MGLTMSQRRAVTKAIATRYARASRCQKGRILDELCQVTGWHRNHARRALAGALRPRVVRPRAPRAPIYDEARITALAFCWAVLGAPTGKRLAPVLRELVPTLRRFGELDIGDETELALLGHVRAPRSTGAWPRTGRNSTCGGALAPSPDHCSRTRSASAPGRSGTTRHPGSPEIDLAGREGGNAVGEHAYTLTVTDIATGWTPKPVRAEQGPQVGDPPPWKRSRRSCRSPCWASTRHNGSEFINDHLLHWCEQRHITFTRSRLGSSNDGAHVEQKNWAVVRTVVGYHCYDTGAELGVLNQIWVLQSLMTNYFGAQQKLISKVRDGPKITKKYDTPTTPHRRAERHAQVSAEDKNIINDTLTGLNPATIQPQIQALTAELLTLTTAKAAARRTPQIQTAPSMHP